MVAPSPQTLRNASIGIVSILFVGVVALGVWMFAPTISSWMRSLSIASEAHFFAGKDQERSLYELGFFNPKKITFTTPGQLIDYVKRGTIQVGVVITDQQTLAEELFLLGAQPTPVTSDGSIKGRPALSFDGKSVAYAALNVSHTNDAKAAITHSRPEDWEIRVTSLDTKTTRFIAKGYAPYFFREDGKEKMIVTTNNGFSVFTTDGAISYTYTTPEPQDIGIPVTVSEDGMHVAIHAQKKNTIELFKAAHENGSMTLFSQGTFPPGTYAVAFNRNDVYALKAVQNKTPLLTVGSVFDAAAKTYPVRTFNSIVPYRLSI